MELDSNVYAPYSLIMTGATLIRIRKRLGITQLAFAQRIGVTANSVARWERGEMKIAEPVSRLVVILSKTARSSLHKGKR